MTPQPLTRDQVQAILDQWPVPQFPQLGAGPENRDPDRIPTSPGDAIHRLAATLEEAWAEHATLRDALARLEAAGYDHAEALLDEVGDPQPPTCATCGDDPRGVLSASLRLPRWVPCPSCAPTEPGDAT